MQRRCDWASPSSRMVRSAALDSLSEVGHGERTLSEVRGPALDRLRGADPRCPLDLEALVDHLLAGLGPGRRPG